MLTTTLTPNAPVKAPRSQAAAVAFAAARPALPRARATAPRPVPPLPRGAKPRIPPAALICPITLQTFVDPVLYGDGRTYERKALAERDGVVASTLLPNFPLKNAAEVWREGGPRMWRDMAEELQCALTLDLLPDDFVTCRDGWSYDAAAMEQYFAGGGTLSPRSRAPIDGHPRTFRNETLRELLQLVRHGLATAPDGPVVDEPVAADNEAALLQHMLRMVKQPRRCAPQVWLTAAAKAETLARRVQRNADLHGGATRTALVAFAAAWWMRSQDSALFARADRIEALPPMARLCYHIGDYARAHRVLEALESVAPFELLALTGIAAHVESWWAQSLLEVDRSADAAAAFQRARAYAPRNEALAAQAATCFARLGHDHLARGDHARAAVALQLSVDATPKPAAAQLGELAGIYAALGNEHAARAYYSRAHNVPIKHVAVRGGRPVDVRGPWWRRLISLPKARRSG